MHLDIPKGRRHKIRNFFTVIFSSTAENFILIHLLADKVRPSQDDPLGKTIGVQVGIIFVIEYVRMMYSLPNILQQVIEPLSRSTLIIIVC